MATCEQALYVRPSRGCKVTHSPAICTIFRTMGCSLHTLACSCMLGSDAEVTGATQCSVDVVIRLVDYRAVLSRQSGRWHACASVKLDSASAGAFDSARSNAERKPLIRKALM